jgi:hypothetical protein
MIRRIAVTALVLATASLALSTPASAQIRVADRLRPKLALHGPDAGGGNPTPVNNRGWAMGRKGFPVPASEQGLVIPHWVGSFNYQGTTFPFVQVGTDPSLGLTSTIPTVIIPYRVHFLSDDTVLDASEDLIDGVTPVEGVLASPLFQPVPFAAGKTQIGNTQFADAMARANYWSIHSDKGDGYHVLLSPPKVLPTVDIDVPADKGYTVPDSVNGAPIGIVDFEWMWNTMADVMIQKGITPDTLPIHLFSTVAMRFLDGGEALGYHWAVV